MLWRNIATFAMVCSPIPSCGLIWVVVNKTEHGISPEQHIFWKLWVTAAESNNMMDWGLKQVCIEEEAICSQTTPRWRRPTAARTLEASYCSSLQRQVTFNLFKKEPWIRNIGWQESQLKKSQFVSFLANYRGPEQLDGLSWSQNTIFRRSLGSWTMLSRGACWISRD